MFVKASSGQAGRMSKSEKKNHRDDQNCTKQFYCVLIELLCRAEQAPVLITDYYHTAAAAAAPHILIC